MDQESYLESLLPASSTEAAEMEAYAKEHHVPIMEPAGIHFLMQMLRLHKPKRILEIGTAIGYSSLRMLEASPSSQIITIEREPERYHKERIIV